MRKVFGSVLLSIALGLVLLPRHALWYEPVQDMLQATGYVDLATGQKVVIVVGLIVVGLVLLKPEKDWRTSDKKWYHW